MEIQFQPKVLSTKMKARNNNKFIGVRQRPSGRWVAEIKDTTQKIRMWLGTFESAEEAARAYDEAACLLRGTNTRTNFVTQVSPNSPLASRIRNLLNSKKTIKEEKKKQESSSPSSSSSSSQQLDSRSSTPSDTNVSSPADESFSFDCSHVFDEDVYKPDLSSCTVAARHESAGEQAWGTFAQELMELPKNNLDINSDHMELLEFERIRVERQISASLYAINGLHEYMETVYDPTDPLWDLPPLCSLLT